MPTDFQAVVYDAVFTRVSAGIAAYNAAIPGSLSGCKVVPLTNALDDRTDGRQRQKLAAASPNDYPQVRLSLGGGNEQRTTTPTFGLAQGVACDAIIPVTVTLTLTVVHDGIADASQTPLEAFIDAGLRAGYPKLGISYCNGFTLNHTRRPETTGTGSSLVSRMVRRTTINVSLRPHLAAAQ